MTLFLMVLTVRYRHSSCKWHWFPLQRMLSSHPNVACHTRIVMGNYNQLMYRGVTLILIVVQVLFCTQWSSIIFQKRFLSVLQWTKNFCCRCSGFILHATEINQWVNVFEKKPGNAFFILSRLLWKQVFMIVIAYFHNISVTSFTIYSRQIG